MSKVFSCISAMPLPDEAKELFSQAVRLYRESVSQFTSSIEWVMTATNEATVCDAILPSKNAKLQSLELDLRDAKKTKQNKATISELTQRRNTAKAELLTWRPSKYERLLHVVNELSLIDEWPAQGWPDPPSEQLELASRFIACTVLIVWPEPMLEFGDLGEWAWKTRDSIRLLDDEPEIEPGREEVLFFKHPEHRKLNIEFRMQEFLNQLRVALGVLGERTANDLTGSRLRASNAQPRGTAKRIANNEV